MFFKFNFMINFTAKINSGKFCFSHLLKMLGMAYAAKVLFLVFLTCISGVVLQGVGVVLQGLAIACVIIIVCLLFFVCLCVCFYTS